MCFLVLQHTNIVQSFFFCQVLKQPILWGTGLYENCTEKPHSRASTKGRKNSLQKSPENIRFLLIDSAGMITMFGKGSYTAVCLNGIHSFFTAVGHDSFVG